MGHGSADVVEQCGGIRPITADCLNGLRRGQSTLSANKLVSDITFSPRPVTGGTLLIEHFLAEAHAALARRQVGPVAVDIDVPACDLGFSRRTPDAESIAGLPVRGRRQDDECQAGNAKITCLHW